MNEAIALMTEGADTHNTTWTYGNGSGFENTTFETPVSMSYSLRTEGIIQLTVSIAGIIANVLSITAIWHVPKHQWTVYNTLIINLSVSDIVVPFAFITHMILVTLNTDDPCSETIRRVILNIALTSVLFNLVLISVDHYIANIHAIRYLQFFSKARVNFLICLIWGVSVACGVFEILVSFVGYTDAVAKEVSFCHHVNYDDFNYELVIIIFVFVVLLCLIVMWTTIGVHVIQIVRRDKREGRRSNVYKTMFTTFLFIGSFVICWCPIGLFHLVLYIKPPTSNDDVKLLFLLNDALFVLMLFNSLCDPVIYAFRRQEVKQGYIRIIRKIVRPSDSLDREARVLFRRSSTGDYTLIAKLSLSSRGATSEK